MNAPTAVELVQQRLRLVRGLGARDLEQPQLHVRARELLLEVPGLVLGLLGPN